eukprot:Plantae.Rhodophyta-Palmaria_palmata.ctg10969.p1 GENE.Plantae.Rhodophyta-Palmaria_palmata.ctg10969~~Plantae.Rhodophyta-Palmaria_palmata.ctg10969.p1  ORF type:complete len:120 (-),score=34.60 Plantae.Rhodophyta-Palmaria_palmata.ctg10969:475-834(-)
MAGQFRDDARGSGKVLNPGKHYFLELGAETVRIARMRTDDSGINYARKAMVLYGMSLDVDGVWKVRQLKKELRELVKEYRALFDSVVDGTYVEGGDGDDDVADVGVDLDEEDEMKEVDD